MTKSIKSLIAASLCLAASVLASGQNGGLIHFGMDLNPATESAQMIRYGNNVPSLYTGAMEYSIPVYTYSDPDFTIPISLDYHFDGFRPAQASGTVGYGWNLGCGGIITREIYACQTKRVISEPPARKEQSTSGRAVLCCRTAL